MLVRALMLGIYDNQRQRPGTVFRLTPKQWKNPETKKWEPVSTKSQFSKKWMVELSPAEAKAFQEEAADPNARPDSIPEEETRPEDPTPETDPSPEPEKPKGNKGGKGGKGAKGKPSKPAKPKPKKDEKVL